MAQVQAVVARKPSFLRSIGGGAKGYLKGTIAGGIVGAVTGLLVGGVTALFAPAVAAQVGMIVAAGFTSIGALAGTMTGVVQSREAVPTSQDVLNLANMSFAQGVSVGHQLAQEQAQQAGPESTAFRERELQRRAQQATQTPQVH